MQGFLWKVASPDPFGFGVPGSSRGGMCAKLVESRLGALTLSKRRCPAWPELVSGIESSGTAGSGTTERADARWPASRLHSPASRENHPHCVTASSAAFPQRCMVENRSSPVGPALSGIWTRLLSRQHRSGRSGTRVTNRNDRGCSQAREHRSRLAQAALAECTGSDVGPDSRPSNRNGFTSIWRSSWAWSRRDSDRREHPKGSAPADGHQSVFRKLSQTGVHTACTGIRQFKAL